MTYREMKKTYCARHRGQWFVLNSLGDTSSNFVLSPTNSSFANAVHKADAQSAISASKFVERTVLADAAVATEKPRDDKYQSQLCAKTTHLFDLPRPRLFTSFTIPCDEQPDWCTARSQLPLHVSTLLATIFTHVPPLHHIDNMSPPALPLTAT